VENGVSDFSFLFRKVQEKQSAENYTNVACCCLGDFLGFGRYEVPSLASRSSDYRRIRVHGYSKLYSSGSYSVFTLQVSVVNR
jgi:hypothetical protein